MFERAERRARLGVALFGIAADPVKLGRFVILDRLGQGGMGVVYRAYDPQLDRSVALKLVRASPGTDSGAFRSRLLREAQALARLAHPNVVSIYDVGVIDDQVFLVMELVIGTTLRGWLDERPRSWRAVLAMYRQAAQGLIAAHAAGIIHRDFKPDNVLVGADDRVRVSDFGLARAHHEAGDGARAPAPSTPASAATTGYEQTAPGEGPPTGVEQTAPGEGSPTGYEQTAAGSPIERDRTAPAPDGQPLAAQMTATGAMVGTPAYMSPEQFAGAAIAAVSDQFNFCASLYEALYRQKPFAGTEIEALAASVRGGQVREPPRGTDVPRWLLPLVRRGLSVRPEDRFPSMQAVAIALARDPVQARRRWLVALAMVALAATTAYSLVRREPGEEPCARAAPELAGLWDADQRAAVERAVAGAGAGYAAEAWAQVAGGLDAYADALRDGHRDACVTHRARAQSDAMLDRRSVCLARRREAMASAVAVLAETDADSLGNVVDVVQGLPRVADCADAAALEAAIAPPADPVTAARVRSLQPRLSRARALVHGGRYPAALAEVGEVLAEAEPLDYRPLLAEAWLVQGRARMAQGARRDAIEPLSRAAHAALSAGMDDVAVEAFARYIFAAGTSATSGADPLAYASVASALLDRLPRRGYAEALLLNNLGVVSMARGDRAGARDYFERSLVAKAGVVGGRNVELVNAARNLAMVTDDDARRDVLLRQAVHELSAVLGPDHPMAVDASLAMGFYRRSPAVARDILSPICDRIERLHPELRAMWASCLRSVGLLEAELGRAADAAATTARALPLLPEGEGDNRYTRALVSGFERFYAGDDEAARSAWRVVVDGRAGASGLTWWREQELAQARLGLARLDLARGGHAAAVAGLEAALPVFERLVGLNHDAEHARMRALTQMTLAFALAARAGRSPAAARDRARALLAAAEAWYRAAGEGYEWRVSEIERGRREAGIEVGIGPAGEGDATPER